MMAEGYREVSRQSFMDDKRKGEWVEGSAERRARDYADGMAASARARKGVTQSFASGVIQTGRHSWAAVLYSRYEK